MCNFCHRYKKTNSNSKRLNIYIRNAKAAGGIIFVSCEECLKLLARIYGFSPRFYHVQLILLYLTSWWHLFLYKFHEAVTYASTTFDWRPMTTLVLSPIHFTGATEKHSRQKGHEWFLLLVESKIFLECILGKKHFPSLCGQLFDMSPRHSSIFCILRYFVTHFWVRHTFRVAYSMERHLWFVRHFSQGYSIWHKSRTNRNFVTICICRTDGS
jgi:hypothetical protein